LNATDGVKGQIPTGFMPLLEIENSIAAEVLSLAVRMPPSQTIALRPVNEAIDIWEEVYLLPSLADPNPSACL